MGKIFHLRRKNDERGSLALEQVLFIGAIAAMSVGLYAFYDDIRAYFADFSVAEPPTNIGDVGGYGGS